jgi:hypothetical protein
VVLRETGAIYYAAATPNAHGLVAYPNMRPIAIDPFNTDTTVYAGIYQSALGQIGFRVDTRVYGVHVEQIPSLATWYGTAHAADTLTGGGLLHDHQTEEGAKWTVLEGNYALTAKGASPTTSTALAWLETSAPTGLIHTLLETQTTATASLIWRFQDTDNTWEFQCTRDGCQLNVKQNGIQETIATDTDCFLRPQSLHSIQILDDGMTFSLYLDGKLVFGQWFSDRRLQTACGVGFAALSSVNSLYFRNFEAHARSIPIPATLDLGSPWTAAGTQTVLTETFEGAPGDLQGKLTTTGEKIWQRIIGKGTFVLTGNQSAKVVASAQTPNPGRTAYTLAWDHPTFVDLEVTITPPGTGKKQKERGRGGLIVWQDSNNYLTFSLYLDDDYNGASIALFSHLNGYEELYDAVWTMIGWRVTWGVPFRLRLVFDGNHFTLFINDEPVLYRALTDVYPDASRFHINRVGIVANWEWGDDTGTQFSNLIAKV